MPNCAHHRIVCNPIARYIARTCTYDRLLTLLPFLAIFVAAALSPMQNDTWWQLRAGADMWSSGRVLLTDEYSHTASGTFWLNHEWLSEIMFYGLYKVGGLPLLSAVLALAITSAWAITWRLIEGPVQTRFAMIAMAIVPASAGWAPRPQALSHLFLMIAVWLLIERRYAWLPLVFLVWANSHGAVLLGFVIVGAGFAVTTALQPGSWRRLTLVTLACVAAVTATPHGLSFWIEIPNSLARIRQLPIDEWRPPTFTQLYLFPFWITAAALCVQVWRRRGDLLGERNRRQWILCGSALALMPLAAQAVRNVAPFLMLAVPALSSLRPLTIGASPRRGDRPVLNFALMSIALAAAFGGMVYSYRQQIPHLRWAPLPAGSLAAVEECRGNLYNRWDEGGYLIWFVPRQRVFLDGRQDPYPVDLVRDQIRAETTGDYAALFARHRIGCAYLPTTSPVANRLQHDGWSTLYQDQLWIVLANNRGIRL